MIRAAGRQLLRAAILIAGATVIYLLAQLAVHGKVNW